MPCNSEYLNPTDIEMNREKVSNLIKFVNDKLGEYTPEHIVLASKNLYGTGVDLDEVVSLLCSKLSNLTEKQQDEILYNGRDKTSRELVEWWDKHQKADEVRIQTELNEIKNKSERDIAIAKLTPHERKLLGL